MSDVATLIADMVRAGIDPDIIGRTAATFAQSAPTTRTPRQERNARYYQKKASEKRLNSDDQDISDASVLNKTPSRERPRGEDNLPDKKISGQEEKTNTTAPKARESDLVAFKAELSDLDAERLEAIVKHRRSKRGQLTGHAARLFRNDATACGLSLPEAVDTCISRNWITVKPEYLSGRSQPQRQSTAPPRKLNAVDAYHSIAREKGWISDEPNFVPGTDENVERLSAVGGGPSGTVVDLRPGAFRRIRSGDL